MDSIDISKLPLEVRAKLAELDLEISEGDITQKGYEKKKARLLEPYIASAQRGTQSFKKSVNDEASKNKDVNASNSFSNGKRHELGKKQFKTVDLPTTNADLFRSNTHSETVQNALAQHKSKRIPVLPMPIRRDTLARTNKDVTESKNSDSTRGSQRLQPQAEDSGSSSLPSTPDQHGMPSQSRFKYPPKGSASFHSELRGAIQGNDKVKSSGSGDSSKATDIFVQKKADSMPREVTGIRSLSHSQPDVTNAFPSKSVSGLAITSAGSLSQLPGASASTHSSTSSVNEVGDDLAVTKVSAKIQQLLLTLKRPKKKPLVEYFQDDEDELLGNITRDENAPKPEGAGTAPYKSSPMQSLANLPACVESAIQRYGTANPKAACLSSLDQNGKPSNTLTYGKLLSRTRKIAYTLTHKSNNLKSGQRVALVFLNAEPVAFACAFHGCLLAGLVPVVVEVPQSSEDPGSSQLGFLLGSCAVSAALTTEQCIKLLPKTEKGEVVQLKGWPRLQWILVDSRHLKKPPSNWEPIHRNAAENLVYVEYKTGKEGSVVGVAHSRAAIHDHCRAVMGALSYNASDIMINLLDFRRGFGLVHSLIASVFAGMHVLFVPYSLTKHNPAHWLSLVSKHKASLALLKSRDLHWTLAVQRENSNINLQSLKMVIVADGANPWSVASCDLFVSEFEKRGLHRNAICPCAWSAEALTVAIKRPGVTASRTALSLNHMSYNVIHEEKPNSQVPSIVLQDCGKILPGCSVAIVKAEGEPVLCKTDEIGEILLSSKPQEVDSDSCYFGLTGLTEKIFKAHPTDGNSHGLVESACYTRTGLLGYLNPSGHVLVTGLVEDTINISGRIHNSNDIIATVLAVEPIRFIYKSRIAIFSINLLKDERLVVVAEQKPDSSEEFCFKWMGNVVQAIEGIHNVSTYCLALLAPDGLPRTPLGIIHLSETKSRFLEGNLQPRHVMMCPHQCITNLPKPRQKLKDIGAASLLQGQVVTGKKMAEISGRKLAAGENEEDPATNFRCLSEILKWRAQCSPEHVLFAQLGSKGTVSSQLTCSQLHKKAEKVAQLLLFHSSHGSSTSLSTGDHVALLFPPGLDFIAAFYGCLYAGCVPVPIRPPHPKSVMATMPTVKMIAKASKSVCILSTGPIIKLLRSKEAAAALHSSNPSWPPILDFDDTPKKRLPVTYKPPTAELLAYLDFSVTNSGTLIGIKMSHSASCLLCRSIKLQCELSPLKNLALCLDPYSGLGLALWCLSSVYSGHQSMLLAPSELEVNPQIWVNALHQYKIRSVYLSYSAVELATRDFANNLSALKNRNATLRQVLSCTIIAEERPRLSLTNNFTKLYQGLGLSPQAVSTSFGCRVGVAIGLQGSTCLEPSPIYIGLKGLRNDRITVVERGSPHSLCLLEAGKILPGMKAIIADPDTLIQCSNSQLGEIWVASPFASQGYYVVHGGDASLSYQDHFQARLKSGDTKTRFARTGFLGFIKRNDHASVSSSEDVTDSLYVIGSLEESIEVRGMKYHPIDIENSVARCSSKIAECVVFQSNNFLVVIAELEGPETSALDMVPLVTNVILEEHYLIAGVVAVTDPGSIPFNSRGEKQRMHLRDAFLHDRLDPIYVAYNM